MDAVLNIISTTSAKLFSVPIADGNLIFLQDHSSICFDILGVRKIYSNIERINTSQKSEVIVDGYYYMNDTNTLWSRLDGEWTQITRSANEEQGITPVDGTIFNNVIISELGNGIFSVGGQYKIVPDGGVSITMGRDLFIVSGNEVHQVNGKDITKYTILDDGSVTTNHYLTDADFSQYIKRDEAAIIISDMISAGVEDTVIDIIENLMATEQDIEHLFTTI